MRKKLQTLREGAGYTQQTFSERLGVSPEPLRTD